MNPRGWPERIIGLALAIWLAAFALSEAWRMLTPLLPFVVFGAVIYAFLRWQRR